MENEPSESKTRRLLELRLLHQYMCNTSLTFLRDTNLDQSAFDSWTYRALPLAFVHEQLLLAILSLTALHIAKTENWDVDAMSVHRDYLDMTLRVHQQELANITPETADATCVTSSFIRTTSLAMLDSRAGNEVGSYEPPMQWLQMTGGSGRVYYAAWEYIKEDMNSISMRLLARPPILSPFNEALFLESNRQSLLPLLEPIQDGDREEMWSVEIFEAYAVTLSYVGSIIIALLGGQESEVSTGRRLIVFPMLVPRKFITLVDERQPRALVILAFYFSMVSLFRHIWYFGDAGEKAVRGLNSLLSEIWQSYMKWPMHVMMEGSMRIPEPFF